MNRGIFETKLYQGLTTISDLVIVSVLWLFTSIPLLTVGASCTALYYTVAKVVRKDTGTIFKEYFKAFKNNFFQCLIPGILYALYAVVMVMDTYNIVTNKGYYTLPLGVWFTISVFAIVLSSYLFPVISRFTNTFPALLRLSVTMAVKNIKTTIMLLFLVIGVALATWFILPFAIIAPGVIGYGSTKLLEPVLKKYMPKPEPGSKEANMWYNM